MAFWGVEVKPGKPFKHVFDSRRGRLRISQATLGYGSEKIRSLVQCNVGNRTPVLLCCLLPDNTESCSLDLEFEEADEVIFSVIGPRSVHITGYYSRNARHSMLIDESESYGEDIANSESQSNRLSDEDVYEDSFIDDNVSEAHPLSPLSNGEVASEDTADVIKPKNRKGFKRLKKKHQLSEFDNADNLQQQKVISRRNVSMILESEDEDIDILPLSLLYQKENAAHNTKLEKEKGGHESGEREKEKKANVEFSYETNIKPEAIAVVDEPERQSGLLLISLKPSTEGAAPETDVKPKMNRKERSSEKKALENCSPNNINDLKDDNTIQNEFFSNLESNPPMKDQHQQVANDKRDGRLHSIEINPKDDTNPKKKRKKINTEESNFAVDNAAHGTFPKEDKNQLEGDKADNICQDQSMENGTILNYVIHSVGEKHSKEKRTKKKNKSKTQEIGENVNSNLLPLSTNVESVASPVKTFQVKTLSNGLTIEKLEMGKPDGQVASQGKRLSVRYTGKLKENGHIFDTNIDGDPFKFRLGKGKVIDGWNIGLDGMRVGDKRRVTIPPSLGYGSEGDNEDVPPNSWLVYDVELISAH